MKLHLLCQNSKVLPTSFLYAVDGPGRFSLCKSVYLRFPFKWVASSTACLFLTAKHYAKCLREIYNLLMWMSPVGLHMCLKSFSGMRNEEVFKQKLLSASKIPRQNFLGDVRYRQQKVWREADALRRMQSLLACMQVRSGLPLIFGKAKRWTIPYRSGC
eukprot:1147111-Pelagomonas_calceolata.AAC.5